MATTIQVSNEVRNKLEKMRLFSRESYNEVIERMIEDDLELNDRTKKEIEERMKNHKLVSHEEVKKRLGL